MFAAFVAAALSVAQSASLPVPYVPQSDALCGGAATAMVFRYWGEAHASIDEFGTLVERHAGGAAGIAADVLIRAVRDRGWQTTAVGASLDDLRRRIDAGQPVIVLLADRRRFYHYVVVVGVRDRAIVVHDPAWGPFRSIETTVFENLWNAAQRWSMVVLPSASRPVPTISDVVEPSPSHTDDACEAMLNEAIATTRARGIGQAETLLEPVRQQCPDFAGPYRELAGVRFVEHRFADAAALARDAIARAPDDAYAHDVLGSSLYMLDEPEEALAAWNRAGKPRLDQVSIEGLHHARYQAINEALGLKSNALLTPDAFAQARHRLEELPDRRLSRLSIRPDADGFASLDVAIDERGGRPRDFASWAGHAVAAAVDREMSMAVPGFTGQGEVWSASWRWYQNRPRVAFGFAAPRGAAGLFGAWSVNGSWEAETYTDGTGLRRQSHTHAALSISDWMTGTLRYEVSAGADVWDNGQRATSVGGSLERRWLGDRLALSGNTTVWMPIDGGGSFSAAGARLVARSGSVARAWAYESAIGAERVSDAAPLSVWPGAGEGRARPTLLRAHPLLDDGAIDVSRATAFGRSIEHANLEVQRWVGWPKLLPVGLAGFVDAARSARRIDDAVINYVDVGAGIRIRIPGVGKMLRVDVAHGVSDGANALTIGLGY
jgi:hypothetical protein